MNEALENHDIDTAGDALEALSKGWAEVTLPLTSTCLCGFEPPSSRRRALLKTSVIVSLVDSCSFCGVSVCEPHARQLGLMSSCDVCDLHCCADCTGECAHCHSNTPSV